MRKYVVFFVFGVLSVLAIFLVWQGGKRVTAYFYFARGVEVMKEEKNIKLSIKKIEKAISFYPKDEYYRTLSEVYLSELNDLLTLSPTEETKERVDEVLKKVMRNLELSIELAPDNYKNWLALGKTHTALIQNSISLAGSRKAAKDAYQKALDLEPEDARDKAQIYFLLAQIEIINEDNIKAVDLLKKAIDVYPEDPIFFLQLGILKYREGDFKEAIKFLEEAVSLVSDYSDARYFLGFSYYKTGNTEAALEQFELISNVNPDNREVKLIIKNLMAGKPPFEQ